MGLTVSGLIRWRQNRTARVVSEHRETRPKSIARSAWAGGYSAPCVISPTGDCLAGQTGTWILQQAFRCGEKKFGTHKFSKLVCHLAMELKTACGAYQDGPGQAFKFETWTRRSYETSQKSRVDRRPRFAASTGPSTRENAWHWYLRQRMYHHILC